MTIKEILAKHPVPWRKETFVNGTIMVRDAKGVQVELLDMLDFVLVMTASIAANQLKAAEEARKAAGVASP